MDQFFFPQVKAAHPASEPVTESSVKRRRVEPPGSAAAAKLQVTGATGRELGGYGGIMVGVEMRWEEKYMRIYKKPRPFRHLFVADRILRA